MLTLSAAKGNRSTLAHDQPFAEATVNSRGLQMASIESRIADVAKNGYFPSPVSRRAFITVAAAAGVALGLGSTATAAGRGARLGRRPMSVPSDITRGPTYCQVTTLSNDFFVAFNDGAKQFTSALGLDLTTLEDDANVNTALSQVGNIQTAGGQMMFGTPASEAQSEAVIKACDEAGIYYGSAYTSPKFLTPADYPTWVRFLTPPSVTISYQTAKTLFDAIGGSGTVVHVPGQPGSSADDERTAGLMQAAGENPDIEIERRLPATGSPRTLASRSPTPCRRSATSPACSPRTTARPPE